MGFDHHSEVDIANGNYMQLRRTLLDNECVTSKVDFYSDTTAKSATSVIYRFFEALGEEIDNPKAYDLFLGLADDATKKGLVKCDGARGIIEAQDKLIKDKNAYEIYQNLKDKLTQEQVSKIAKTIDLMSSLTSEQKEFKNSLQDRTKLSQNGTIAYVEISPDDEEWKSLGGDNTITSTILNRHRQSILSSEKYEMVANNCPIDALKTEDGYWVDDGIWHTIQCKECGTLFTCSVDTYHGFGSFRKGK